ncbi:MAG: hypothetical protein MI748_08085, partial [Opitutales bacterium]|nr:hypothetical protein [Opitutales bacterium]
MNPLNTVFGLKRSFQLGWKWFSLIALCVWGNLAIASTGEGKITAIQDLEEASLVSTDSGIANGVRMGMKMIAYEEGQPIAEMIVIESTENESQLLITDFYGSSALTVGNRVAL